jgi:hypothetical protein
MTDDTAPRRAKPPGIDVSPALGEAGHEVEELGYEGIPDTGPALGDPDAADLDPDDALDIALTKFPTD